MLSIPFRLIPLTVIACLFFAGLKVYDIAIGQDYLARGFVPPAYAADGDGEEDEDSNDQAEKEAEGEGEEEANKEEDEEAEKEGEEEPVTANKNVSLEPPEETVSVEKRFSQVELDILQSLSGRREELDDYERELSLREKMLEATEMRINNKIKQMERMQGELETLMNRNKQEEDAEMQSLVKIYETMKPKEAARIFNELDMSILLQVLDRMSERKAAPILANMIPKNAQEVTVRLAEMRQLRQQAQRDLALEDEAEAN